MIGVLLILLGAAALGHGQDIQNHGTRLPSSCAETRLIFYLDVPDGSHQLGYYKCDGAVYKPFSFPTANSNAVAVLDKGGQVHNVKAYGAIGNGVTDDTAAIQTVLDLIDDAGTGTIYFPRGNYLVNTTVVVNTSGVIKSINMLGDGPTTTGSIIRWTGSTSGQLFKFNRMKFALISGLRFDNAVGKGTTTGVWLTGPGNGEQNGFLTFSNCIFANFHVGMQGGDAGNVAAAGEILVSNCLFESNDTGWLGTSTGNTLVILFVNTSAYANTEYGFNLGGGSGDTHIIGGGVNSNGLADIALSLGWNHTVLIEGMRFEVSASGGGIVNVGGMGSARIQNCNFKKGSPVPGIAMIRGYGSWDIEDCSFGDDAQTGWIPFSGASNRGGSLRLINNRIQNDSLFELETVTTGQVGMRVEASGNYRTNIGAVTKFDDLSAIVGQLADGKPALIAYRRNSGTPGSDLVVFGDQVAAPSVAYATNFKTRNSRATTYTDFQNGAVGQIITVVAGDAVTSVANNANIVTASGAKLALSQGLAYSFIRDGSVWRQITK